MYRIELLHQRFSSTPHTPSTENKEVREINFKNDKEVIDFLKKAETIQTKDQRVNMLSVQEMEKAIDTEDQYTLLEIFDDNKKSIGFNYYPKEAYPYVLNYIEDNK